MRPTDVRAAARQMSRSWRASAPRPARPYGAARHAASRSTTSRST